MYMVYPGIKLFCMFDDVPYTCHSFLFFFSIGTSARNAISGSKKGRTQGPIHQLCPSCRLSSAKTKSQDIKEGWTNSILNDQNSLMAMVQNWVPQFFWMVI